MHASCCLALLEDAVLTTKNYLAPGIAGSMQSLVLTRPSWSVIRSPPGCWDFMEDMLALIDDLQACSLNVPVAFLSFAKKRRFWYGRQIKGETATAGHEREKRVCCTPWPRGIGRLTMSIYNCLFACTIGNFPHYHGSTRKYKHID